MYCKLCNKRLQHGCCVTCGFAGDGSITSEQPQKGGIKDHQPESRLQREGYNPEGVFKLMMFMDHVNNTGSSTPPATSAIEPATFVMPQYDPYATFMDQTCDPESLPYSRKRHLDKLMNRIIKS